MRGLVTEGLHMMCRVLGKRMSASHRAFWRQKHLVFRGASLDITKMGGPLSDCRETPEAECR
jgi:hypothetical protein